MNGSFLFQFQLGALFEEEELSPGAETWPLAHKDFRLMTVSQLAQNPTKTTKSKNQYASLAKAIEKMSSVEYPTTRNHTSIILSCPFDHLSHCTPPTLVERNIDD